METEHHCTIGMCEEYTRFPLIPTHLFTYQSVSNGCYWLQFEQLVSSRVNLSVQRMLYKQGVLLLLYAMTCGGQQNMTAVRKQFWRNITNVDATPIWNALPSSRVGGMQCTNEDEIALARCDRTHGLIVMSPLVVGSGRP